MKNFRFLSMIALGLLFLQFSPQTNEITRKFFPEKEDLALVTPGLIKQKGFTNYQELIQFITALSQEFPNNVTVSYVGYSKKGLAIPLVRIGNGSTSMKDSSPISQPKGVEFSGGEVPTEVKIRVWMQGGLHGDEPASTESLLYLMYQLMHNENDRKILDRIELAILPMANIDGYIKQQRNNAEGLDLNRDQTKLMAAESIALKSAFSAFSPQVALDFHEYRPFRKDFVKMGVMGVSSAYDVMFLYSGNLNVPKELRQFTQAMFVHPTMDKLALQGLASHDYVTSDVEQGELNFNQGSNNARSSATNYALQDVVSSLIEVRGVGIGRTSFKRRVFTGYSIAMSYLEIAAENIESVKVMTSHKEVSEPIAVKSAKNRYRGNLSFIDLEKVEKVELEVNIVDAWTSRATLSRARARGYMLNSSLAWLVPKIKAYGLRIDTLKANQTFQVESFTVITNNRAAEKNENMYLQEVKTNAETSMISFSAGTLWISMNQRGSNVLIELLEPEALNSFVSFGVLPVKVGDTLPIYRILE